MSRVTLLLFFFALPIVLRLALLPHHPVPIPSGADDFSYVLLGDTLAHFRLANPAHPLNRFFETDFVLQEPTYSSIFPPGQGLVLAFGQRFFGHPWFGVLVSIGLLCAACYWMLLGWTTPGWALVGGLLGVCQFGPLSPWMNTYFGGALAGVGGCLTFGALPRLAKHPRLPYAALAGAGLGVASLSRPFESIFLAFGATVYLIALKYPLRTFAVVGLGAAPAAALILLQNQAVTGNWTTLPYMLSRYHYGVPASFTFQENPVPHRNLTREQQTDYQSAVAVHGAGTDTPRRFVRRLVTRLQTYRFFFYMPLWIPVIACLARWRMKPLPWLLLTVLIFMVGTNVYPYFLPHYIAALTSIFLLISVIGLDILDEVSPWLPRLILAACAAQFLFWYGSHLSGNERLMELSQRPPNFINWGDPEGRIMIQERLNAAPGKHLVFVRRGPANGFSTWVRNAADIDAARIVWARDLGAGEDKILKEYYPDRRVWLLEPDLKPPSLRPYEWN